MFNSITNKKVYEQVIDQIQEKVMDGSLKKGDKLPSERDLAEELGVSRASIREAIRVLETMGVIDSRQGEGNFICSNIEKSLIQPLAMIFKLNGGNYNDIYELRRTLEIECVRLAAKRADAIDLRQLQDIIKKMEEETFGKKRYNVLVELDKDFHNLICNMTKNYLIQTVFETISDLFEKFIEDARKKIISYDIENANYCLYIQHKEICESIIRGDEKKAVISMEEHMKYIMKNGLDELKY